MKLDLSRNRFTGEKPFWRGKHFVSVPYQYLHQLGAFVFVSSAAPGEIPTSLAKLMRLEKLNIQNNLLTGGFPPELCGLTALKYFDISRNDLTGVVPEDLVSSRVWLPWPGRRALRVSLARGLPRVSLCA